jgi:deoxyribonuclease V
MLACVDVHYVEDRATAAALLFGDWADARPLFQARASVRDIEPYVPGRFYVRELPCILKVLECLPVGPRIVLVDGHVWLEDLRSPGLGARLYEALGRGTPVIGVAKNPYKPSRAVVEVRRGRSRKPLYVTAAGIDRVAAADHVAGMHGPFRIPTLLREVDRLCRQGPPGLP